MELQFFGGRVEMFICDKSSMANKHSASTLRALIPQHPPLQTQWAPRKAQPPNSVAHSSTTPQSKYRGLSLKVDSWLINLLENRALKPGRETRKCNAAYLPRPALHDCLDCDETSCPSQTRRHVISPTLPIHMDNDEYVRRGPLPRPP